MLRFPLGVFAVLILATSVPVGASPRRTDAQEGSSATYRDGMQSEAAMIDSNSRAEGGEGGHPDFYEAMPTKTDHSELQWTTRIFLNELVQATGTDKENQVSNIAFVKTHKTASTTLAAIMYRYAVRHDLQLAHFGHRTVVNLESAAAQTKESKELVDVMHYHIALNVRYDGTWDEAVKCYKDIMRHPDRINFVTVLREPRSHLLSFYYYYFQPTNQLSIEEYLMDPEVPYDENRKLLLNPLSAEFGVTNEEEMESFIDMLQDFKLTMAKSSISLKPTNVFPWLSLDIHCVAKVPLTNLSRTWRVDILLSDRLDEGLLVLRRLLHWHMIDLTYISLNKTTASDKRWDGKPLVDRPHFDSLPKKVQQKIDELTDLDRVLYHAGMKDFEKRLASYGDTIQEENAQFQELQSIISNYLDGNSSSMANPMYRSMQNVYQEPPLQNRPF